MDSADRVLTYTLYLLYIADLLIRKLNIGESQFVFIKYNLGFFKFQCFLPVKWACQYNISTVSDKKATPLLYCNCYLFSLNIAWMRRITYRIDESLCHKFNKNILNIIHTPFSLELTISSFNKLLSACWNKQNMFKNYIFIIKNYNIYN